MAPRLPMRRAICSISFPCDRRAQLFREFFHPSEMGFSACRICIGSSDYATKMYSFDEGAPDAELRRFSIDHDREYILPMLQLGRSVNPDLFLLATPWSPPGWMKAGGSMLGGSMRKKSFGVYARYLLKFIKASSDAGVTVNALSVQNEVDTDQDARAGEGTGPRANQRRDRPPHGHSGGEGPEAQNHLARPGVA